MEVLRFLTPDRILAVIAIIAGIVAVYYERRLHRQFKAQDIKIEKIVLSVHTSYIGSFPADLEKATELIVSAKNNDELLILTDFLGFGHYSSPEQYGQYVKALSETKGKVRMLVYGEASTKESLQAQFKKQDFEAFKTRPSFTDYFEFYKKRFQHTPDTYEDFLNDIIATQDCFSQTLTLKKDIEIRAISSPSINEAVFFWMIPQREMVFSFPNFYFEEKGFSFKTRDDHFMEIFSTQFNAKWGSGLPIVGNCYSTQRLFSPDSTEVAKTPPGAAGQASGI